MAYALALALVHLLVGKLPFIDAVPRSRWLSIAGGVSVAYVFVHILPEVGDAADTVDESGTILAAIDYHIYLITLAGFVVFYGLERFAVIGIGPGAGLESDDNDQSASAPHGGVAGGGGERPDRFPDGVFWIHTGSFGLYNALIGYLLVHQEEPGVTSVTFFFVAMALHFMVNDVGLREHHGRVYHRYGRWLLAGAVLLGFAVGAVTEISEFALALLFAFLSGGVILNVVKEELPSERQSRFWAFAAGAAGYSLVLLTV
ncbi:hypothetical protein G6M89_18855 [Natronolimnobius sp. AArcel1]|uniref:hypothetical protein n=1 Tax=Natronolimnobius sp. AArcel1 TaxID=1679093 RepID=UPI0013EDA078|nr:hypothetical protein [Natronolimnobius sp. AArcel1]NGM71038.1 hypothetical protein [Natronolimnobius sp. AArcel1]